MVEGKQKKSEARKALGRGGTPSQRGKGEVPNLKFIPKKKAIGEGGKKRCDEKAKRKIRRVGGAGQQEGVEMGVKFHPTHEKKIGRAKLTPGAKKWPCKGKEWVKRSAGGVGGGGGGKQPPTPPYLGDGEWGEKR